MSIRKFAAFSFFSVFFLFMFLAVVPAPKVLADATCYGYQANSGGFKEFPCSEVKQRSQYKDFNPTDGCYKVEFMGAGQYIGMGQPQKVDCAEVQGKDYAQCYVVREYTVGGKQVKATKKEPCTAELQAKITANTGKSVQPNTCYIIDVTATGNTFTAGSIDCGAAATQEWNSVGALNQAKAVEAQDARNQAAQQQFEKDQDRVDCGTAQECLDRNQLTKYLVTAINFLSGAVAIVVTIVIVMAGIQYSTAGGDPGKTAQAKKHILNAIIALLAYFTLFMFMQWLVPGGFLN